MSDQTTIATAGVEITGDASGVEVATNKAKRSIAGMAQDAQTQYQRMTAAEKRVVDSLHRQTSALGMTREERLRLNIVEKTSGSIQQELLKLYGQNTTAQQVQKAAYQATSGVVDKTVMSQKELAFAMRGVPAQISDIVVSLQGGQRPMTVFMQQGFQLRDMFHGWGPAAKALSSTLMGMISPMTLLGGGAALLAAAAYQGSTEMDALDQHLTMTGGAAGVTANQVSDLAARLDALSGVTRGGAVQALTKVVSSGKVAAGQLEIVGQVVVRSAQLLGRETADVVAEFAKLADKPAEASAELNEKYNYLTASVYRQIKALEDQGRADEAAALAQDTFAQAAVSRLNEVETQLNAVGRVYQAVTGVVREFWDAAKGIGRQSTTSELLGMAVTQLEQMEKHSALIAFDVTGAYERQKMLVASLRSQLESEEISAGMAEAAAKANQAAIDAHKYASESWAKLLEDSKSRMEKRDEEIANAKKWAQEVGASETELANVVQAIREKYKESGGAGISASQAELANLRARIAAEEQRATQLAALGAAQANLNEGEKQALAYAEKIKLVTDAKTKAVLAEYEALAKRLGIQIRANDAYEFELKSVESSLKKVREESRAMQDRIAVYGMSKGAIEKMTIARLREREALLVGVQGQENLLELIRQEITEREKLGGLLDTHEVMEQQRKAAEDALREWERVTDQIGQSLTDALMRGFEDGKGLAENFRDSLKNMFKTMVLQPMIQPVMSSVAGSLMGHGGTAGAAAQSSGGLGIMGAIGQAQQTYSLLTGGMSGSLASGIGWLGQQMGSTALNSFAAGMKGATLAPGLAGPTTAGASGAMGAGNWAANNMGSILGYGSAIYSLTQGQYGSALGTAIGTYIMPGVGTMIGSLVGGLADDLFGGGAPRTRHSQRMYASVTGNSSQIAEWDDRQSSGTATSAASFAQSSVAAANALFQQAGINAAIESFYAIMESSVMGDRDGVASGGKLRIGDRVVDIGISDAWDQTKHGFGGWSSEDMSSRLGTDIQLSILEAFQKSGLLSNILGDVNIRGLDAASAQALVDQVNTIVTSTASLQTALEGLPLLRITNLSFDAAASLLELGGGLETLTANVNSYIQNYFSVAEQQAALVGQVKSAFDALGIGMPASLQAMRALIEAQDVNTESGRKMWSMLMQLQDGFAQVTRQGIELAWGGLQKAVSAEKTQLQKDADAIAAALGASIQTASASVSELTGLTGRLQLTLSSMVGQSPATERTYAWAQARIERALSVATLTGIMPSGDDFETALQLAAKPNEALYGSFEDYYADYLRSAHTISSLNDLAGDQLTAEQKALDALNAQLTQSQQWYESEMARLDAILAAAQTGVEQASGTATAILSVAQALESLRAAGVVVDSSSWAGASFAVGTNYVPSDMIAQIHEGERIIPAADNRQIMEAIQGRGESMRELAQEVRQLRASNEAMQALLREVSQSSRQTAESLAEVVDGGRPVNVRAPSPLASVIVQNRDKNKEDGL